MQIKKSFILPFIIISALGNCEKALASDTLRIETYLTSRKIKAEKSYQGMFYSVHTEGNGAQLKSGDFITINYTGKLLTGQVFDKSSEPYTFQLGYGQVIKGWEMLLPTLKVGTKTTLYVPAELAYGSEGIGDIIPPNTPLVFDIEIKEVVSAQKYNEQLRALEDNGRKELYRQMEQKFLEDKKQINDYAISHKLRMNRTESGISYLITKEGKGDNCIDGKTITFHYEGFLLNDKKFHSSKDNKPVSFKMGTGKVMSGWEEGLQYFNKGSEGYLVIPSRLAAESLSSDEWKGIMPAKSVLVFKIQVLDIN